MNAEVVKVIEEIKEEIRIEGIVNDIPGFDIIVPMYGRKNGVSKLKFSNVEKSLDKLTKKHVSADIKINSSSTIFGKCKHLIKCVIYKGIRCVLIPFAEDITKYHKHLENTLMLMLNYIRQTEKKVVSIDDVMKFKDSLEQESGALRKELACLHEQHEILLKQVEVIKLNNEITSLKLEHLLLETSEMSE